MASHGSGVLVQADTNSTPPPNKILLQAIATPRRLQGRQERPAGTAAGTVRGASGDLEHFAGRDVTALLAAQYFHLLKKSKYSRALAY